MKDSELLMNYDWATLRDKIMKHGVKNSLLTTIMPTASTSQIMGNVEACEPQMSNIYVRKTLAGEYIVINEALVKDLIDQNLWNETIRAEIIYDSGSIQNIDEIPKHIKELYKTAHEMKQKDIVDQSIERGPFIDQTQSLNLFMDDPNFNNLTSSHMYSWKHGIKTGMYYLHSKPAIDPIQFGIDAEVIKSIKMKRLKMKRPHIAATHVDPKATDKATDKAGDKAGDAEPVCKIGRKVVNGVACFECSA